MEYRRHSHLREIPNRYHFIRKIEEISEQEVAFGIMFLDVMRFSDISSAFDHKSGDQVLLQIVNQIHSVFSNATCIGRLSGDIFGVVFSNVVNDNHMRGEHARLISHFKAPLNIGDSSFIVDFNVGAAIKKRRSTDVNTVISLAESALRESKSNRHVTFTVLSDESQAVQAKGLALKADLTRAMNNNELELYVQPKVDLNSFEVVGGECLLRWHHPLDGVVFPGALLQAAESYNMMNELGYWTLEAAFENLARMQVAGYQIPISVNLSPSQLYDTRLMPTMRRLMKDYAVPPELLELELTEDVMLTNSLLVKQQLDEIKSLGIALSMDDFGKGYSNLSLIRDLDLHAIKIDKTFVFELSESPVNSAIINATKVICDAKGCETIAEGIETPQQLSLLQALGINKGQGFLFSPAVPINEFLQQLEKGHFSDIMRQEFRYTG